MAIETEKAAAPAGLAAGRAGLVERVKRILLEPKAEWKRIDTESSTVGDIFRSWVLILAAVPAVSSLIGSLVFGYNFLGTTYRPGVMEAVATAISQYVLAVAGVFVLALIIDALAPKFGGASNRVQAMKVAAYSATAAWVAGIFGLVPALAFLAILGLYSLYLLYLGLPRLMKAPVEKAMSYTVVTIVAAIVIALLIGAVMAPIRAMFGGAPANVASGELSGKITVPGAGELDLGKLGEATEQLEAAAAQMQSGEGPSAPTPPAALQALLPTNLGPYSRSETSSSAANAGGFGGSQAAARYEGVDGSFELQVVDVGAAGALAALGGALNVQSNRQTETGYEKTESIDGRMVTEKWDNESRRGSYGVLVGNRLMVQAEGTAPNIDTLKEAVHAIGIERVETLAR